MKHEGYFVSRSGFRLKLIIERPELHNGVTFHAKDPEGKRQILLNGSPNITMPLVSDCTMFTDVLVTGKEGGWDIINFGVKMTNFETTDTLMQNYFFNNFQILELRRR